VIRFSLGGVAVGLTYLLLLLVHSLPSAGALVGDILGLRVGAQVFSNSGSVVLHVQEVRGERTLGRIRVYGGTLAPLATSSLRLGAGTAGARNGVKVAHADGHGREIDGGGGAIDNIVDMLDIGLAEFSNLSLEGHAPHDYLWRC